ncbi:hypothetical protein BVX98_06260, partial [bacterium F11]
MTFLTPSHRNFPTGQSRFRRVMAGCLSLSLLATNVLFAYTPEKNFWDQRQKAVRSLGQSRKDKSAQSPTLLAKLTSAAPFGHQKSLSDFQHPILPIPSVMKKWQGMPTLSTDAFSTISRLVSGLSRYGVIRDINLARDKNPIIVYIQDVHGHLEAQKNIGSMILSVLEDHPKAVIGLEGAAGDILMEEVRQSNLEINKEVGSFFLNAGIITGGEYAGFAAKTSPTLFGVEDPDLYLRNVAAVHSALLQQKKKLAHLQKEERQHQAEKQDVYSTELMVLDQKWQSYHNGDLGLGDYLTYITQQVKVPSSYSHISLFLKTWALENSIHIHKADRERTHFLSLLIERLSKKELDTLLDNSVALRSGLIPYPDYYRFLKETAAKAGVSILKTPEFSRYVNYVIQADSIKPELLLSEVTQYEKDVWATLCKTSQQKQMHKTSLGLVLSKKLVQLTLTSHEWNEVKRNHKETHFGAFESFYEAAEERNSSLSSNLKRKVSQSNSNVAVVVAGGFHSEGLKKLISKKEATLLTVSPKLTEIDNTKGNDYLNVFTRDKTPLEKRFEAPKISMVMTLAQKPIGGVNPIASAYNRILRLLPGTMEKAFSNGDGVATDEDNIHTVSVARKGSTLPARPGQIFRKAQTDKGTQVEVRVKEAPSSFALSALMDDLLEKKGAFGKTKINRFLVQPVEESFLLLFSKNWTY